MLKSWWLQIVKNKQLLLPNVISSLLNIFILKSIWIGMIPVGIMLVFFAWTWSVAKIMEEVGIEDLSELDL